MQEEFLFSPLSQFASAVSLTLPERGTSGKELPPLDWPVTLSGRRFQPRSRKVAHSFPL